MYASPGMITWWDDEQISGMLFYLTVNGPSATYIICDLIRFQFLIESVGSGALLTLNERYFE